MILSTHHTYIMTKHIRITILALLAFVISSVANANNIKISANVALASEYIFRGLPQTDGELGLSGGFDFTHDSGLYAGVWAANVNFDEVASLETDLYLGWNKEVYSDIALDVGVIAFTYSGDESASDSNLTEIYTGLSWQGLAATYYFGTGDATDYFELSYAHDIENVSVSATFGYADFVESYNFYGIGISTQLLGLDIALNWTDNNTDVDDTNLVLSLGKSF